MELFSFYNVENLFLPDPKPKHKLDPTISGLRNWDERKYQNKLFKISHVFQLMKEENGVLPFMIGLSEVSGRKVLEDLVKLEPFNEEYGIVHYNSMDERKVDVALLYDKNKVEVIDSETITFFFEILKKNTGNYDTTRDVLYSKVRYKGEIVNVFIAHLPSKREKDINKPKRAFILNEIRGRILNIVNEEKEHVILCGDFNENPDDENLVKILYDDVHGKVLENPFQQLFSTRNYSTFHYKSGLLFDQILLSKSFFDDNTALSFQEANIFKSEKISSRDRKFEGRPFRTYAGTRYLGGYSDHFPVFVKLKGLNTT
ncbi:MULTISPECIES: endonuclease/exonuclease/phosphatase family protein [Chryseobacterium]|jgi:exonuclease III|uniref:Endonuclease/exonuclease/phosphatase family metal-dependent hydrolase n=1 Tax=Chryseobacterium geocarposphaerae TaxID=1416776 RepID=A0ABU1LDC4_9FLAO|nr:MULTISPECIES: endonuclease/exonuclease/phosphatase family protein [Chryseobacterium]ALR31305.1 endonuclease [Chryseobacterium sp. IHB B 17019]MDR6404550.1 endonuclease/exonuclease/phosphatase family metal-dependent hydrolase [Chryseobacterium geocarposphaerae]MDR6698218.1 endonuclease/exonuclease/phosphatase family metal-dependent hydrolase [Chryseobacterium ginsenosidimutans]